MASYHCVTMAKFCTHLSHRCRHLMLFFVTTLTQNGMTASLVQPIHAFSDDNGKTVVSFDVQFDTLEKAVNYFVRDGELSRYPRGDVLHLVGHLSRLVDFDAYANAYKAIYPNYNPVHPNCRTFVDETIRALLKQGILQTDFAFASELSDVIERNAVRPLHHVHNDGLVDHLLHGHGHHHGVLEIIKKRLSGRLRSAIKHDLAKEVHTDLHHCFAQAGKDKGKRCECFKQSAAERIRQLVAKRLHSAGIEHNY